MRRVLGFWSIGVAPENRPVGPREDAKTSPEGVVEFERTSEFFDNVGHSVGVDHVTWEPFKVAHIGPPLASVQ